MVGHVHFAARELFEGVRNGCHLDMSEGGEKRGRVICLLGSGKGVSIAWPSQGRRCRCDNQRQNHRAPTREAEQSAHRLLRMPDAEDFTTLRSPGEILLNRFKNVK